MICLDPRNPRAAELFEALRPHLDPADLPDELCLVVGGDGWMLRCIRENGPGLVYLGLNAGNLGFLLNEVRPLLEPAGLAAALRERRWLVQSFPRLGLDAWGDDGPPRHAEAVNDVYVERSSGHTAHLRLVINGLCVVERMVCDGLIVATGLGSTAYSFSAGGVPCHPLVRAVHVTPICPHTPRLSPFTLMEDARIEIEILHPERRPARVVSDGVDHGAAVRLCVARVEQDVRLAFLEGHHFTTALIQKILRT